MSNPVKLAFWVGQSLIGAKESRRGMFPRSGDVDGLFAAGPYRLRLDQSVSDCVADQTRRVMDIELLHQVGTVGFRGLYTDVEQ